MDTFTFLIALMLMMLAFQFGENWLVFAIIAIMILSMRSLSTTVLLLVSAAVLYFFTRTGDLNAYWPVIVFGLIIVALVLGLKEKEQQPEFYAPDMGYGDMMGGMGGLGGMGGGYGGGPGGIG